MNAIRRLLESDPFVFSRETSELFLASLRECAARHYDGSAAFRAFWERAGIRPEEITSEEKIREVPPILVNLFKEWELSSVSPEQIVLNLTSSGTSGQKSQILLDQESLENVKKSAWEIHRSLGITSEDRVNYLCFTYDPKVADHLGTAFTDELLTSFTRKNEVYYAIQWDERRNDFALNIPGVLETLQRFSRDHEHPTRILGFPAHLYKILRDSGLRLQLGPKAWVQTGGGWKGLANEEIPKSEFRAFVADRLGLPQENIRDMFGMVEHGIPYVDCRLGRLHIPNYSRVFIRSPFDLGILPEGETGLIHLLCSYNTSYPSISLLTTDWGRLGRCACGITGQTLEIAGRAGVTQHKGCAITAAELLKG